MTILVSKDLEFIEKKEYSLENMFLDKFSDKNEISDWAKSSILLALDKKLIKGDDKGYFNPKSNATRAESAVLVKRLLEHSNFLQY